MIGIVIIFAALALIDIPPLAIRKEWGTMVIVCALLLVGLAVAIVFHMKKELPSLIEIITSFMQSAFEGR